MSLPRLNGAGGIVLTAESFDGHDVISACRQMLSQTTDLLERKYILELMTEAIRQRLLRDG